MLQVLKKPILTEKAARFNTLGQYAFEVDINANKIEIKKAIEAMFGVNIESIRTVRKKGKETRRFTRKGLMQGKKAAVKKAYITLKAGQTIDIVAGESNTSEE